jgi:hypothetical protein
MFDVVNIKNMVKINGVCPLTFKIDETGQLVYHE